MSVLSRIRSWRRVAYPRHSYKAVWTSLSMNADDARYWVQGTTEDAALDRSAPYDAGRIMRHLQVDRSSDVLEIGCGVGRLGAEFSDRCRTWTGCDVSPHMLRHAQTRLRGRENVRFVEVSGHDLQPVADSSMDAVYCTVVFMHLSEWDRYNYISDALRVLRPGGQLYVDNVSLTTDYGWKFFEDARRVKPQRRPAQIGQTSTPQEFETYFSRAGLTDTVVEIVDEAWVVGYGRKPTA